MDVGGKLKWFTDENHNNHYILREINDHVNLPQAHSLAPKFISIFPNGPAYESRGRNIQKTITL